MAEMRVQKFLAEAGIASRRKCEELINLGRISVNGKPAVLGNKVNPESDLVALDGKVIKLKEKKVYILLNKPIRICNYCKRPV